MLVFSNLEVISFAGLVRWGIAVRYNRPIYKWLMPIGTLGIMAPAINRWPLQFMADRPIWIRCSFCEGVFGARV